MTEYEQTLAAMIQDIKSEAKDSDCIVDIISESDRDILTYDYIQNRNINYHIQNPDENWLNSLLYITPDVRGELIAPLGYLDTMDKILMQLDPNLLTCLRHIIVTTESEADNMAIAEELDIEPDEICDFDDYLGMFWYNESAVVINMTAIIDTIHRMKAEMHMDEVETAEESVIGVYSTLIHELRHLALENPYLDEKKYPESEKTEDAVEQYCRNICDNLIHRLKLITYECYFPTKEV